MSHTLNDLSPRFIELGTGLTRIYVIVDVPHQALSLVSYRGFRWCFDGLSTIACIQLTSWSLSDVQNISCGRTQSIVSSVEVGLDQRINRLAFRTRSTAMTIVEPEIGHDHTDVLDPRLDVDCGMAE